MTGPVFLRMKDTARISSVSLRTAWARAKSDPDHPPLIKHSPRVTVVEADKFQVYLNRKRVQTSEQFLSRLAEPQGDPACSRSK